MDPIELIKQGKINRFFRARNKLNVPDLVYHVTQRAAGKEPLFVEKDDYMAMLALMKDICRNHQVKMYAFCMMPNHFHFLLSPSEENLSESMKNLFSRYALRFNKKYERKGHLLAGPFRQATVLDDSYLLAVSLYIHLNPVRAELARDPADYRWSSVNLYLRKTKTKSFVDPDYVLGVLPEAGPGKGRIARQKYAELLRRGAVIESGEALEDPEAIETFHFKLVSSFPWLLERIGKSKRALAGLDIELESMPAIEKKIDEIKGADKPSSPETRRAKRYLIEQLVARGFKRKEIAEKLGICRKSIYNILSQQI